MTPQEKVLNIALAEVGYLEKKSSAQLDSKTANAGSANYTKYARDLDAIQGFYNGRKQGTSWCDVFVDWVFVQAFGGDLASKMLCQPKGGCGAGVLYSARYFQAKNRFVKSPQPGDQIFFGSMSGKTITKGNHTGLVVEVKNGMVYTVEGNTSGASGVVPNGGGVRRKSYSLSDKQIIGYGRPDWNLVPQNKEDDEMNEDRIREIVREEFAAVEAGRASGAVSDWAANAWNHMHDEGMLDGTRPLSNITRQEIAVIIERMLERTDK